MQGSGDPVGIRSWAGGGPDVCQAQAQTIASLKATLDDVGAENARLHDRVAEERAECVRLRAELREAVTRIGELDDLVTKTVEAKDLCLAAIKGHEQERSRSATQRQALANALDTLRTKTLEAESAWKKKEKHWAQNAVRLEERIRDLAARLAEANRLLKTRTGAGHYKQSLEEAQHQIRLLKRRLRAEQVGKVRSDLAPSSTVVEPGADPASSIEALALKRDNVRLTVKVRTLEDRIAEKNQELNGFSAQLRELQGLLHANLEKQSQSAIEAKTFGRVIQDLRVQMEQQTAEIRRLDDEKASMQQELDSERGVVVRLQRDLAGADKQRNRLETEVGALRSSAADIEQKADQLRPLQKALVEIAAERDRCRHRADAIARENRLITEKAGALQVTNDDLSVRLAQLEARAKTAEDAVAAQSKWFQQWKGDVSSISVEMRAHADQVKALRQREAADVASMRARLEQSEKELQVALAKNARMNGVLERLITGGL